jgi:hypothetical protein
MSDVPYRRAPEETAMTEGDLRRLEAELGLQFPAAYRRIVTAFPEQLRNWPAGQPAAARQTAFLFDVDRILKANRAGRRKLRRRFPEKGYVLGGDPDGWWLIDTALENPPVLLIFDDYTLDGFEDLDDLYQTVQKDHAEAWAKANKRSRAGKKPALTAETLLAEGRRLARPAVALRDRGTEYAAVWRGAGVADPGPGEWRHWISIDAGFLPQNPRGMKGVVSVYDWFADDDRMGELRVVNDPQACLPVKPSGKRLFAHNIAVPPDVDALFHFGAQSLRDWLELNGSYLDYDRPPVKDYLRAVRRQHPFSAGDGTYAMLGGWSWCFNWCYGTDEEYPWHLFDQALIVLTLEDSEPWIEVVDDGKEFQAFARIT